MPEWVIAAHQQSTGCVRKRNLFRYLPQVLEKVIPMTSRLRRKRRTTVRNRQRILHVSHYAARAYGPLILSVVVLGIGITSITASAAVGQQSYRPPVHISPNQQYEASQRYTGIAALDSGGQANQSAQYDSGPTPHVNQSPHLQARIANAFNFKGKRNRRGHYPAYAHPRQAYPQQNRRIAQAPTPISEHQLQQEYIPHHMRNQFAQEPTEYREPAQPSEQVVQRRPQPNRYPVQQIRTSPKSSVLQTENETNERIADLVAPDPYYDQPSIRVTSGQELEEEPLPAIEPEQPAPESSGWRERPQRISQTPVYPPMRERPVPKTKPVSILNSPENSSNIDPSFNTQDEDSVDIENTLRQDVEEVESLLENLDEDPEDEELPERERQELDQNCDELRYEMLNNPITEIALDISPPRSGVNAETGAEYRTWTDQFGRTMGSGAVSTIRRGQALVQTEAGWRKIPVGNMSDGDLDALASYWQLPKECTISTSTFTGRSWVPQTVTWKASNLCHKPLFFENVQLERYGHSHGPFLQPVHSTVHFFSSIALAPYNMGITPANECQYALGFYRPGNCAPWLREPFPISLAGARFQASSLTAGAFLFFP